MTSTLSAVVVDCRDPETLARFWCAALGYVVHAGAEGFVGIVPAEGSGPHLDFVVVPEPRTAKNRLHLDLRVTAGTPPDQRGHVVQAEVGRLVAAGARVLWSTDDHHVTMADPEGNEFCVAWAAAARDPQIVVAS